MEALSKPRNVTHTLYKLYEWMEKGLIDVDPEFQRDVVWKDNKQSHLIDSIINNFYIPPVIFSCKKIHGGNKWLRVCIDGKQRLTSIYRFMKNEIPHLNPGDGNISKRYFRSEDGRNSISEEERDSFECCEFVCVEYYDLTLTQEQEIFSRVQLGVPLTPAEKLAVISTPLSDFSNGLYATYPKIDQIVDTKRGRAIQLISQTLYMIQNEPERFNATPAVIQKYLQNGHDVPFELSQIAKRVFTTLTTLIEDKVEYFTENNRFSPIEFVFFCWLIAKYPGMGLAKYQENLKSMKTYVRQHHVDIRFNQKVYATLKKFVEDLEQDELVLEFLIHEKLMECDYGEPSKKKVKFEY